MTRKHFEALANELKSNKPVMADKALGQWYKDCLAVASVCGRFNGDFDSRRFLQACGCPEEA